MNFDYDAIAALAAVAASSVAVAAWWSESRRARFSLGIDLLLKLDERFWSDSMLQKREAAANYLDNESPLSNNPKDLVDLLHFFEMLGLLLRRRALDEKMVWELFSYWFFAYYYLAKDFIEKEKQINKSYYSELTYLCLRMLVVDSGTRQNSFQHLLSRVTSPLKNRLQDDFQCHDHIPASYIDNIREFLIVEKGLTSTNIQNLRTETHASITQHKQ